MKKVYLLLRNNIESGPYTIDELIQQKLRPSDLVWINGKSLAWSYPSELEELKSFVPKADKPSINPKLSAATYFSDEIEQKAEELRQKVMSFVPKYYSHKVVETNEPVDERLRKIEKEGIEFTDHRKKDVALYEMLSAVVVTLFVAVSVYGGYILVTSKNFKEALVATKSVSVDQHTAKAATRPKPKPPVVKPDTLNQQLAPDTSVQMIVDSMLLAKKTPKKTPKTDTAHKKDTSLLALGSVVHSQASSDSSTLSSTKPSVQEPEKKDTVQAEHHDTVMVEPEKKKSLGQVLKGLFKKKKKPEKPAEPLDTTMPGPGKSQK